MRRLLLIALAALAVGACNSDDGGSSDKGIASLSGSTETASAEAPETKDRQQAWLDFAACMREQGVDMPDPEVSEEGAVRMRAPGAAPGGGARSADVDVEEVDGAREACKHHIEGLGGGPGGGEPDPEQQDRMVKFAQCMREQGIDMPDPSSGGERMAIRITEGDRDKMEEARKACQHVSPVGPGGPGGPGAAGGPSVEPAE